jgi:hypothetical protein
MTIQLSDFFNYRLPAIRVQVLKSQVDLQEIILTAYTSCTKKGTSEKLRISSIKLLIALLPETEDEVEELLTRKKKDLDFENHFTMFCFFDQVVDLPGKKRLIMFVDRLTDQYLSTAKSNTAYATFMAGDFLGAHWTFKNAFPIFKKVLLNSRYLAPKKAVINGLIKAYERGKHKGTLELLKTAAKRAKNNEIKLLVKDFLLKQKRKDKNA